MPHQPQTDAEWYVQIRDQLSGETPELTSFAPNSPEDAICRAFAEEFVVIDHLILYGQLSGWVQYAGGPIGEDELLDLSLDPDRINIPLLNSLLVDADLDALAAQSGVERIPGSRAQGRVLFGTTETRLEIPAGTVVATERIDTGGGYRALQFRTAETVVSPATQTTVTARIEATESGPEFNVGAGQITQLPQRPGGIEGVTNPEATSGGEGPETNRELRERVQNAPTESSGGGTAAGMEGAVVDGIAGIEADDVATIEQSARIDTDYLSTTLGLPLVDDLGTISSPANGDPAVASGDGPDARGLYLYDSGATTWAGPYALSPLVQVVVDGGTDTDVADVVDDSKPAGIAAEMVRPTPLTVDIDATVTARYDAADIDAERIGDTLTGYLSDLGLGEDVFEAQLFEHIMDADEDVVNVDALTVTVDDVAASGDVAVATDEVARAGTVDVSVAGAAEGS